MTDADHGGGMPSPLTKNSFIVTTQSPSVCRAASDLATVDARVFRTPRADFQRELRATDQGSNIDAYGIELFGVVSPPFSSIRNNLSDCESFRMMLLS